MIYKVKTSQLSVNTRSKWWTYNIPASFQSFRAKKKKQTNLSFRKNIPKRNNPHYIPNSLYMFGPRR